MLRRRRKSPKIERPASHPAGRHSRRRPRPGAAVPPELLVTPQEQARVAAAPAPHGEGLAAKGVMAKAGRGGRPTPEKRAPQAPAEASGEPGGVVLVTGFEPFGGERTNPSWEVCERLARTIDGRRIETCHVPCEFRRSIEEVAAAIERHSPSLVIALGQAGGRAHVSVERVAINVDDARIEDNAANQPVDEPIAPNGPPAYFATVPIKAMVEAMRAAGVPAEVSNSAGTYVCNHLMYGVLHFIAASGTAARGGFIHLPYAEDQVLDKPAVAAMSIDSMVRAVEAAIAAALRHREDLAVPGGSLD